MNIMNSKLQCSICLKKNDYKSELQQYDCKFCLTKDLESNQDKLICKDCMKKIKEDFKKCPFCNSSVKSDEKIDVYRTTTGTVVNNIIVKRKSCIRSCKNFLCKDIDKLSVDLDVVDSTFKAPILITESLFSKIYSTLFLLTGVGFFSNELEFLTMLNDIKGC